MSVTLPTVTSFHMSGPTDMEPLPLDFTSPLASGRTGDNNDDDDDDRDMLLDASLQRMDDEADAIMTSIREELFTPPSNKPNPDAVDTVLDDRSEDEMHDDFEMDDELSRLNNVVASIKEDLDAQSVVSMTSAISDIDGPPAYYRYPQHTFAMRAHEAEQFLQNNKLYGPGAGGEETNTPLLIFTIAVWTILTALVLSVKYGNMDENGSLPSLLDIFPSF